MQQTDKFDAVLFQSDICSPNASCAKESDSLKKQTLNYFALHNL